MDVAGVVERVADDLRLLADVDLDVLSDQELDETLDGLQRLHRLLDGQLCRLAHRWEQRGVWASDGSRSSTARMARDGQTGKASAQRVLLRGRRLEASPVHCQHASGCDEPIDGCDADHIVPSSFGGVTSQDNGRLLCTFHNRIEPQHARPPTAGEPFSVLGSRIAETAP